MRHYKLERKKRTFQTFSIPCIWFQITDHDQKRILFLFLCTYMQVVKVVIGDGSKVKSLKPRSKIPARKKPSQLHRRVNV